MSMIRGPVTERRYPFNIPVRGNILAAGGGGNGGAATYTGAYADIPACSVAGDIFLPNDGQCIYICDGSNWIPYGAKWYPCVLPVSGDFAWLNQGATAQTHQTYGEIYLQDQNAGAWNLRGRIKAAPSTPYTVTALMSSDQAGATGVNRELVGILFYESSSTKLKTIHIRVDDDNRWLEVGQWNNATSWATANYSQYARFIRPYWLRLADDGTNLTYHFSVNGQDWIQIYTELRGAFFTSAPSHVGFFINPYGGDIAAKLLSWEEA